MEKKISKLAILTKGIIKENPVLVLLLGTCPTLATTSSAFNGMGMGCLLYTSPSPRDRG